MSYVVIRNFVDKETEQYHAVGSSFQASNENRAKELENRGFIAAENSEAAQTVQSTNQEVVEEAQTVVNGEVVSLKAAQEAVKAAEENVEKTGVRESHNNASEPVQAGKKAKSQTQSTKAGAKKSMRTTQLDQKETAAQMQQPQKQQAVADNEQNAQEQQKTKGNAKGKQE